MKPKITILPSIKSVEGADVIIFCNVTGYPRSQVRWNRMVKNLPRNVVYRNDNKEIVLRSAKHDDSGIYTCSAENTVGTATALTTLWIDKGGIY